MKQKQHFLTWVLASSLLLLAFAPQVEAGGSLDWEEVAAKIAKDDPLMAAFIAQHLDVARVGVGVRVGHDKDDNSLVPGLEIGTRIPPYDFEAKPKGAQGDYSMEIHLEEIWYEKEKKLRWRVSIQELPKNTSPTK